MIGEGFIGLKEPEDIGFFLIGQTWHERSL
jgi:hypothetical protein